MCCCCWVVTTWRQLHNRQTGRQTDKLTTYHSCHDSSAQHARALHKPSASTPSSPVCASFAAQGCVCCCGRRRTLYAHHTAHNKHHTRHHHHHPFFFWACGHIATHQSPQHTKIPHQHSSIHMTTPTTPTTPTASHSAHPTSQACKHERTRHMWMDSGWAVRIHHTF